MSDSIIVKLVIIVYIIIGSALSHVFNNSLIAVAFLISAIIGIKIYENKTGKRVFSVRYSGKQYFIFIIFVLVLLLVLMIGNMMM